MSFVAGFGVEIAINAVVLGATLLPPSNNAKVRIGCGSRARGETTGSLTGGGRPDIVLYDTHGQEIGRSVGGESFDPGTNPTIDMGDLFHPGTTISPEYLKIVARGDDAVCVSYVSATSAGEDKRTWHAGYAKECARHANADFWYPSPEIIPGTDFRPGCVWMSSGDRFLSAISVKLTDFAFPTSEAANKANIQFEETPNTLCQAPGRMTFWETTFPNDCIPFYNFDVAKNETTGFDIDYQKIVDGHTMPCTPLGKVFNQNLEPGGGPITHSPEKIRQQEEEQKALSENGENPDAPPPGAGSFGGKPGTITQEDMNEQGLNPDGPAPGAGSFGGVTPEEENEQGLNPNGPLPGSGGFGGICGVVPPSSTADPGEFVSKLAPCSKATPIPSASSDPDAAPIISRRNRVKRQEPPRQKDHCVDRLVISHLKDHSARELCGMNSSWGPDFVSIAEKLHCNMCTRELSRLCGADGYGEEGEDCFDLEKRILKRPLARRFKVHTEFETLDQEGKTYVNVSEWNE